MNRAGVARLAAIANAACDERRAPLSHERKLQLLAELYGTRKPAPDLFTPPEPAGAEPEDKAP